VEDPNDPSNDLGRNSYNISRVRGGGRGEGQGEGREAESHRCGAGWRGVWADEAGKGAWSCFKPSADPQPLPVLPSPLQVRMAFDWAYCQLTAPADPGASLLQRIIR
jgi:hypothetical protein